MINILLLPSNWLPPSPQTSRRTQYTRSPSPGTACQSSGCQIIFLKSKPIAKPRTKTQPRRKVSTRVQCPPSLEKNMHREALRNAFTGVPSPRFGARTDPQFCHSGSFGFASLSPCLSQTTHLPTPRASAPGSPRPLPPRAAALSSEEGALALWLLPWRDLADRRCSASPILGIHRVP